MRNTPQNLRQLNNGQVLQVDATGNLVWVTLPPAPADPQVAVNTGNITTNAGNIAANTAAIAGLAAASELKAPVANAAALPPQGSGNNNGDIRIALDNGHMHIWSLSPFNRLRAAASKLGNSSTSFPPGFSNRRISLITAGASHSYTCSMK